MLSKLLIILIPPQYVRVSHPIQEFARKKDKKTEKCNSIVNVAGYWSNMVFNGIANYFETNIELLCLCYLFT